MPKKYKLFIFLFFSIIIFHTAPSAAFAENIYTDIPYESNEILVKFKKNPDKIFDSSLNNFAGSYNLNYQPDKSINDNSKRGYFLFETKDSSSVKENLDSIKKDSRVKNAQPNFIFQPAGKTVSAKKSKSSQDKFFNREWWLYNNGAIGTAGSDIYLLSVWNQEQENWPGVVVGIVDSGINQKHKDLKGNVIRGYDFVHGRGKKMRDKEGHGSFIAGLIASKVNNKKGIAGLSRLNHLKVMPLKFDFSTDEAISAIAFAQSKGVRILNTSWGTNEFDQALYDAIKSYNGLVIAAAGNESSEHNTENSFYPCDFDLDNILCVGASDENDRMADYSDFGQSVDILAPGGSEAAPLISLDTKTNRYAEAIGTSFSAAFVSGAAGLVLSANPSVSNLEIKKLILGNVRTKEEFADKVSSGGILNVRAAVNRENIAQ